MNELTTENIARLIKSYVAIKGNNLAELNKELNKANVHLTYNSARYDYDNPANSNSHNGGVFANDK